MSFPKMGNTFLDRRGRPPSRSESDDAAVFVAAIADALRRELEPSHSALKVAAAWTHTNERTVKNWLCGHSGPSGHHLGQLARHSDEVLCAFLLFAGRDNLLETTKLIASRDRLRELLQQLDGLLSNDEPRSDG